MYLLLHPKKVIGNSGDCVKDDKTGRIAPMPKVSKSIPKTVRKIKKDALLET